ncbi:MAG TPA: pyrroline-5-carboxylate reductase [Planctomycetota bacterium]|nr:pyrroline-5-carboxylate reductase [Planctomycetota bacterium]
MNTSPFDGRQLALIGAGNMAEALLRGALAARLCTPRQVTAADPSAARREVFAGLGARVTADNREAAAAADVLILAVKPQQLGAALAGIGDLAAGKLAISIVAGAPSARIAAALPGSRVVRTMPNTPLLVGMGATGIAAGAGATPADMDLARALFEASGLVVGLHESELDAVTAVSGSGPAYLFYLAEAMIEAGRAEGLPESSARRLTAATLRGAAELLSRGEAPPEELRRRVTSPGGTTAAAVEVLDSAGVGTRMVEAVRRAAARSRELGRG